MMRHAGGDHLCEMSPNTRIRVHPSEARTIRKHLASGTRGFMFYCPHGLVAERSGQSITTKAALVVTPTLADDATFW